MAEALLWLAIAMALLLVAVLGWLGAVAYEPPPRGYRGRR